MSGVLRWEEPPKPGKRGTRSAPKTADWYLIAAQLRGRPNAWAAVATSTSTNTPSQIRAGWIAAFKPAGSFEAKGLRVDGVYTLYVRYVGEAS